MRLLGKILGSTSKFYVSTRKLRKIFEKIVRDLESFTFTLFLNSLFIIVSREYYIGRIFSEKIRVPTFIQ